MGATGALLRPGKLARAGGTKQKANMSSRQRALQDGRREGRGKADTQRVGEFAQKMAHSSDNVSTWWSVSVAIHRPAERKTKAQWPSITYLTCRRGTASRSGSRPIWRLSPRFKVIRLNVFGRDLNIHSVKTAPLLLRPKRAFAKNNDALSRSRFIAENGLSTWRRSLVFLFVYPKLFIFSVI